MRSLLARCHAHAALMALLTLAGSAHATQPERQGQTMVDGVCVGSAWHVHGEVATFTPVVDRERRWQEGVEAARLRRFARQMHARGAAVDDPCADESSGCLPALAGAFDAFDRAVAVNDRAGVVIFGNSLIAADRIVNVVRRRLTEQLGDAGRGFVLADRLGPIGPRDRTATDASGWVPTSVADLVHAPEVRGAPHGVAGAAHVSVGPAVSRFRLAGEDEVTVMGWALPGRPGLSARVDQGRWQPLVVVDGAVADPGEGPAGAPILHRLHLPKGAASLELRTTGRGAVVHGVALEHGGGGVVVDTFGVAAADAPRFLDIDATIFETELDARQPDLVVLMLGGNETKRVAWKQRSLDEVATALRALIRRTRPGTDRSCLVVGPIDAVVGTDAKAGQDPLGQRPELTTINDIHRHVALAEGCAYIDLYAAMGGKGSLQRLKAAGALHDDLVHPREQGLAMLGQLVADALLQAWRVSPHRDGPWRHSPPPAAFAVATTLDDRAASLRPAAPKHTNPPL